MSTPFTKAKWIWLDAERYPDHQESAYTFFCEKKSYCVAHFKKTFFCEETVAQSTTYVSADCKYLLWLNDEIVSRGPAAVGGDYGNTQPLGYRFFDRPYLAYRKGENTVEALVVLQPAMESDYSDGHGGFIFESDIVYASGREKRFISDESWAARKDEAFERTFYTDLTKKSGPFFPAEVSEFPRHLVEKNIPELACTPHRPVGDGEFAVREGGSVLLDFGKVFSGYLRLFGRSEGESALTMEFFEREGYPITFRDSGKEHLKLPEGPFAFTHLHLRSARYVKITAERGGAVFRAAFDHVVYPALRRGSFRCSDERLERIYEVCVRTTLNCMNTYHMDSPVHQEAIGCTGDYLIQSLVGYYAFGDTALTRLDLWRDCRYFELKNGHRLHTAYGIIWVEWLLDYVRYSGDMDFLAQAENALNILMARYESYLDENGIVSRSHNFWFIDWSLPEGIGMEDAKIVWQAALTAFTYRGFACAAELMYRLGKTALAEHYDCVAAAIRRGFCTVFWDEERGLYFGGLERDGTVGRKYFGTQENILAVLFGLTDRDPVAIMEKVVNDGSLTQPQPYFMHFLFQALNKVGLFEKYALGLLLQWVDLLAECDSSLKEIRGEMPGCDYSHAWSATPAFVMPALILGVSPAADGFAKIGFEPHLCGLEWAEGVIPTPHGDYFVRIDANGKKMVKLQGEKVS